MSSTMDASSRRPQLPALSYLEVDKPKREDEQFGSRHTVPSSGKDGFVASPTNQYPSQAPPPYTPHPNSWPGANNNTQTPPDSRRTSGDDHEQAKQNIRQSLPSISEALGPMDGQTPYQPATSTHEALPPPPSHAAHHQPSQLGAPRSPSSAARRTYPMEPPPSHNPAQYAMFRQDSAGPQAYPHAEQSKPAYGPYSEPRPVLQAPASLPPPRSQPANSYPYPDAPSPRFEQQPASSMPPPPSTFAYGYTPYPPRFAQPSQAADSGPIYQPSAQYAAPQTPTPAWKQDGASRYSDERPSGAPYGESVKRHLDMYDLEASLNEISQTSGAVSDFSRRYGNSLHQSARSGPSLASLPGPVEIDDMIQKTRIQMESLNKIRDVVLAEQAAFEQQMADQRHKAFADAPPPSAPMHDDADEMKSGFPGSDTKKRRGRAAPPGRCHSCNRAETPEWRRGPDGARTLCNACGLHYAKLTRKQTTASKGASVGSSNLRPKEG